MQLTVGSIVEGKVTGITKFGAFVELEGGRSGMIHISEVADVFVNEISDFLTEGQTVRVKIINITEDGKISLSIKKANPRPARPREAEGGTPRPAARPAARPKPKAQPQPPVFTGDPAMDWTPTRSGNPAFEDMLQKYKQRSEEKMSDMKRGQSSRRGYSRKK